MTKRAFAAPFLVPSPNGTSMQVQFDLSEQDHQMLAVIGDFVGGLYRTALRCWIVDASAAHGEATLLAQRTSQPLFEAADAADKAAACSGTRRDRLAALKARRKAEKVERDTYRDSFYEFEKTWMTDRKRALTADVTSRQAGTVLRAAKKQRDLALRNLDRLNDRDTVEIGLLRKRLGLQTRSRSRSARLERPEGDKRVKGYVNRNERFQKQRRLQILQTRVLDTTERIELAFPKVCVGSKKLLKTRHNLKAGELTENQWREQWDAARRFIAGNGETGRPGGNDTIRLLPSAAPGECVLQVRLPKHLEHLSNTDGPQAMYQTSSRINWDARNRVKGSRSVKISEWHERIAEAKAVGYQINYDADVGRWLLTVSWTRTKKPRKATAAADAANAAAGTSIQTAANDATADDVAVSCYRQRCVGIDLNAGHIDAFILDQYGNPVGRPIFYEIPQQGTTEQRRERVCETLHRLCREHLLHADIHHAAIEALNFADIAAQGRNGPKRRGAAGRTTRRKTLSIPTSKFTYHAAAVFNSYGIAVVAVDPAYTSRWGAREWQPALNSSRKQAGTRHSASSVVIGRRSQGHDPWRSPGVSRHDQSRKAGSGTRQVGCSAGQDPANVTNPNRVKLVSSGTPDRDGNDEPEQHHGVCADGSPGTAETGAGYPGNRPGQPVDDVIIYAN